MKTVGEELILLEHRSGDIQLFDVREATQLIWTFRMKESATSIHEVGEFVCIDFKNDIRVLEVSTGKEMSKFSVQKEQQLCGVIEGNEVEDMFLVLNNLNSRKMHVFGLNEYDDSEEGKPIFSYFGHTAPTTQFIRYKRELYATRDASGSVFVQFGNTNVPDFEDAAIKLYKANHDKMRYRKTNKKPIGKSGRHVTQILEEDEKEKGEEESVEVEV